MLFEQAVYEYIDAKQFGRKPVRANTLEGYAGTPLETVSLMLGHSSVSMAYEHYLCGNAALLRDAQKGFAGLILAA